MAWAAWPHCVNPGPCPVFNSPMAISSPSITAPHSTVCTFCSNASRSSSSPLTKGISRTRIGFPMSTSEITLWIITPVLSILPSSQAACARSMAFYYGVRMNQQIFVNKTKKREREGGVKKKKRKDTTYNPIKCPGQSRMKINDIQRHLLQRPQKSRRDYMHKPQTENQSGGILKDQLGQVRIVFLPRSLHSLRRRRLLFLVFHEVVVRRWDRGSSCTL